jgi:hypothetical protein
MAQEENGWILGCGGEADCARWCRLPIAWAKPHAVQVELVCEDGTGLVRVPRNETDDGHSFKVAFDSSTLKTGTYHAVRKEGGDYELLKKTAKKTAKKGSFRLCSEAKKTPQGGAEARQLEQQNARLRELEQQNARLEEQNDALEVCADQAVTFAEEFRKLFKTSTACDELDALIAGPDVDPEDLDDLFGPKPEDQEDDSEYDRWDEKIKDLRAQYNEAAKPLAAQ